MIFDIVKHMRKVERRLKRAKIVEPDTNAGEYVDQCHWSKTGWAVWRADGSCTCEPAEPPK